MKTAVGVGEGDQHVFAARPDVQGVLIHAPSAGVPACVGRGDRQLLVSVAEWGLVEASAGPLQDCGANRRGASIGPDEHFVGRGLRQHLPVCEIDAADRTSEADRDSAGRFGGIEEERVQALARDGKDDFVRFVAVGNELEPPFLVVKHPSGHRNEGGPEALHHADLFERRDAAVGEGQVDRAAGGGRRRGLSGIRSALEKRHAVSAPGQKNREERAGETGADERDLRGVARCSHRSARRLHRTRSCLPAQFEEEPAPHSNHVGYVHPWINMRYQRILIYL